MQGNVEPVIHSIDYGVLRAKEASWRANSQVAAEVRDTFELSSRTRFTPDTMA